MPLQFTPQNLQQLVDLPVGMRPDVETWKNNAQQADAYSLQDILQQNMLNAQLNPLKVQQQRLANDLTQAQIPGVRATSSIQQRADRMAGRFEPQQIEEIMSKYKSEELARHVKDAENLGQVALQGAAQTTAYPLGAAQRLKAEWEKAGYGKMWNPEWDSLSPARLAMSLSQFGSEIQGTSARFRQAMELQDAKNSTAQAIANTRTQASVAAAQARANQARDLASIKAGSTPKTYEAAAIKARQLAAEADTPEEQQSYLKQADDYDYMAARARILAASESNTARPQIDSNGQIYYPESRVDNGKQSQPKAVTLPNGWTIEKQ